MRNVLMAIAFTPIVAVVCVALIVIDLALTVNMLLTKDKV